MPPVMRRHGMGALPGAYPGFQYPGQNLGQQNPQPVPGGGQVQYTEDFFTYSINIGSITTLATSTQQINIQADSDFEWVMSTASGNLNGNSEPWTDACVIPITVTIVDSGSGRQLMNSAMPMSGLAGTGKQPFILPIPRRFNAKSTVTLVFTSFSASTWDHLFFNMIGRKIFDVSP